MKHDWQRMEGHNRGGSPFTSHDMPERRCKNCGKWQRLDTTEYSVMTGATRRWRPLAGKCERAAEIDNTHAA